MKKYNVSFELIKEKVKISFICFEFECYMNKTRFAEHSTGQTLEYESDNIKDLKIEEIKNK